MKATMVAAIYIIKVTDYECGACLFSIDGHSVVLRVLKLGMEDHIYPRGVYVPRPLPPGPEAL